MAPLLAIGLGIGLAITAAVPPDAASSVMEGRGGLAVPIAAALGTPLYFSTELFVPIADSLTIAGVSTGAVVALTIAGAGANVPEFVILGRLFQRRLLIVFVAYVFAVAMIWGITVIADSAQFSSAVAELSEPAFLGTMLTVQTCAGFTLTLITIHMMPPLIAAGGWPRSAAASCGS